MTVDTCVHCQNCVNRFFNTGRIIEIGIGNISSDVVIVVPRIYSKERRDNLIKDLKAIWFEITDDNMLEHCYVTYDIKCPKRTSYGYDNSIYANCNHILNEEMNKVPYRYMIVLGNAIKTVFPNCKPNKYVTNGHKHIVWCNEKMDDKQAIKDFMSKAINWINYMRTHG